MISLTVLGINFGVSVGFVGILSLMLYVDRVGLMLPAMLAVILHELGHLIALLAFKERPRRVELRVGAVAIIGNFALTSKSRFIMLLAGSGFNFILFAILYFLFFISKAVYLLNFSLVMLVVGILNLLPIMGLDGGEILKLILLKFLKTKTANAITFVVSFIFVLLIIMLGFYILTDTKSNISLIIFGIYLFLGILMSKKKKNDCKMPQNIVK